MPKPISKVRQVSQISVSIPCDNIEKSFRDVRHEILRWAQRRAGRKLPKDAWEGNSFDRSGARPAEAIHLEEPGYYAFKLVDDDKNVPQRHWSTEVAIAKSKNEILLGVRLFCVTMGEGVPFVPSVPGLVRQIAENHGATIDGRPIGNAPWIVDNKKEVGKLLSLLVNPKRKHDVCIISTKNESENPSSTLIRANKLFTQTIGAIHVVVLTSAASYELTKKIGKELSVFNQSVRTYRPGFNPDESEPHGHPIALMQNISMWDGGPSAFSDFLITQCLRRTITEARKHKEDIPSYTQVQEADRQLKRERNRQTIKSKEEELDLAYEEIEELQGQRKQDKEKYEADLSEAWEEKDRAIADRNEIKSINEDLNRRIQYLESLQPDTEVPIPKSFDELGKWSQKYLAGKVHVHNRAIRSARSAEKECGPDNIRLAYETLLILRDHYVPMRTQGGQKRKKAYQKELQSKGLKESPSISGQGAGKQGKTYFLNFRGEQRILEDHLKKGVRRDPRNCFRLYFFWDSTMQQVVVGSFPEHLKIDST